MFDIASIGINSGYSNFDSYVNFLRQGGLKVKIARIHISTNHLRREKYA